MSKGTSHAAAESLLMVERAVTDPIRAQLSRRVRCTGAANNARPINPALKFNPALK
jgi:hypothetical protein